MLSSSAGWRSSAIRKHTSCAAHAVADEGARATAHGAAQDAAAATQLVADAKRPQKIARAAVLDGVQ
eukprot:2086730-Prymnesium_polylepis.1